MNNERNKQLTILRKKWHAEFEAARASDTTEKEEEEKRRVVEKAARLEERRARGKVNMARAAEERAEALAFYEENLQRMITHKREKRKMVGRWQANMVSQLEQESKDWITAENVEEKICDALWDQPASTTESGGPSTRYSHMLWRYEAVTLDEWEGLEDLMAKRDPKVAAQQEEARAAMAKEDKDKEKLRDEATAAEELMERYARNYEEYKAFREEHSEAFLDVSKDLAKGGATLAPVFEQRAARKDVGLSVAQVLAQHGPPDPPPSPAPPPGSLPNIDMGAPSRERVKAEKVKPGKKAKAKAAKLKEAEAAAPKAEFDLDAYLKAQKGKVKGRRKNKGTDGIGSFFS